MNLERIKMDELEKFLLEQMPVITCTDSSLYLNDVRLNCVNTDDVHIEKKGNCYEISLKLYASKFDDCRTPKNLSDGDYAQQARETLRGERKTFGTYPNII
jgi:hypothetical protein|nr:MAG TPA: hypothetical protein [Caudoviricetes sp.]